MARNLHLNSKDIKCKNNKKSVNACINKSCEKYAFMCFDSMCSCQNDHKNCLFVVISRIKDSILSKTISLEPL